MITAASELKIGKRVAKNRVTMAPTVKFFAGDDGMVTPDFVRHYEDRAKHECGFIVVEATCVMKEARLAPTQLGLWCDEQIEGHRQIAEACHKYGALVVPQIHHGGVNGHPACGQIKGPSAYDWVKGGMEIHATALTIDEIHDIQQRFVDAAIRAQKAGYDGVQLHGCHRYLINDFASAINVREDEYGGSIENKARFGCEIIRAIRKACGEDFIISIRTSGYDPTVEDSIAIAECYVAAGVDFLQVSSGVATLEGLEHDESLPYNKIASLGVRLHEHFKGRVPVSLVNGIRTPDQVKYLFEHELIDAVDLACGLLADPAFTEGILYGAPYEQCRNCRGCGFYPAHHKCPAGMARGNIEFHGWEK